MDSMAKHDPAEATLRDQLQNRTETVVVHLDQLFGALAGLPTAMQTSP
jgi:hypothetical protein